MELRRLTHSTVAEASPPPARWLLGPVFQGLAQGLERGPAELGQSLEEQHPVVRQRHLARPWVAPSAGEPQGGDGVARRPEGPPRDERPVASPLALWTLVTSIRSSMVHGGKKPGILLASMVFQNPAVRS